MAGNDKDKLFYSFDKFQIKKTNNLDVRTQFDNGVLTKEVRYCNYKLSENDKSSFCNLDVNDYGLYLTFNPNKVLKHDFINKDNISFKDFNYCLNEVEQVVNDNIGVELKIKTGLIKRYDNSFDLTVSKEFNKYANVLKRVNGVKSGLQRNANDFEIKNSLYFGNKTQKVICYNKTAEIKSNIDYYNYLNGVPSNLVRFEHRKLKEKSKLILGDISEQKFYNFRAVSKDVINKRLFQIDMEYLNEVEFRILEWLYTDKFLQNEVNRKLANLLIRKSNINLNLIRVERNNPNYRNFLNFKDNHNKLFSTDNEVIMALFNEIKNEFNKVV